MTARPAAPQHDAARSALYEFVRALARAQAIEDHLAETGQEELYDPRRDLRPV
ncbi:hypothetical protein [Devosia sp.]|uniref:hypothetical protein n=1 Tax=Devosia sp. TaxID=1871048 RepID=UPI002615D25A|nr:hypothetical protein [Devosia sp.]